MPQKLPDKYTDPDGYEHEQARRMRAARKDREAYDVAWNAAWARLAGSTAMGQPACGSYHNFLHEHERSTSI